MEHLEGEVHNKREDKKINQRRDKITDFEIADRILGQRLGIKKESYQRIDNIVHERLYELLRGATQNKTDGKPCDSPLTDKVDESSKCSFYLLRSEERRVGKESR